MIAMSELLPGMGIPAALLNLPNQLPVFASHDVVPFRFTPNLQHFIGECFTEGILVSAMVAIGRALSEPQVGLLQKRFTRTDALYCSRAMSAISYASLPEMR
jgi:transformation/transcription domain-associated protein